MKIIRVVAAVIRSEDKIFATARGYGEFKGQWEFPGGKIEPGETPEEFEESRAFVDSIDFYETHIFKYSRREGTKAAVMPDQVDEQIKAKRSAQLIELGEKKRAAYEQSFQGKEVEVLVEEDLELNGKEVQTGHTKEYMKIALETNENLKNSIVKVQIGKDSQIIH